MEFNLTFPAGGLENLPQLSGASVCCSEEQEQNENRYGTSSRGQSTCVVPPVVVVFDLGYLKGFLTVIIAGCTRDQLIRDLGSIQ
jgi:hypothetical protein